MDKAALRKLWDEMRLLEFFKGHNERPGASQHPEEKELIEHIEEMRSQISPEYVAEFEADLEREMAHARREAIVRAELP